MFLRLFLLFTLVPLLELYLLIRIGEVVGVWFTVGLVVLTGALGAALARFEGLRVLGRVREEWGQGRVPTRELLDGLLILIAGAVLLTPGLITDCLGFFLLSPPGRALVRRAVTRAAERRFGGTRPDVIDVEWRRDRPD
ncbi:MAG: FxsA family protein [Candidatus Sulfomarinibacteraceae bacterium]